MSALGLLVGLAYGALVTAVGIAFWSGFRDMPHLSRGADWAAWAAASLLVLGVLLAWGSELPALEWLVNSLDELTVEGSVASMILIATLAIPLGATYREEHRWSRVLLYVPALLMTAAALVWLIRSSGDDPNSSWVTPLRFSLAVCAGLGARTLGRSLQVMVEGTGQVEWSGRLTYGLLTLVSGSAVLVNLWQRGMVWTGVDPVTRGGIAGAWLAWSADWLARDADPRLRAALTTAAALLLVLVATRGG